LIQIKKRRRPQARSSDATALLSTALLGVMAQTEFSFSAYLVAAVFF